MEVLSSRILLRPHDFADSLGFYTEKLGLRIYREFGYDGNVTGVVLFLGGGFLELSRAGASADTASDIMRLWLQVPDLRAEYERLRSVGVRVIEAPTTKPWGLEEMWIEDPDGHRIVMVEVPPTHPLRRRVN